MQDYDQHQLASGSTLTQQQIDGFLLLLRQLASYRNRNSRNIGEQFRQVPGECSGVAGSKRSRGAAGAREELGPEAQRWQQGGKKFVATTS